MKHIKRDFRSEACASPPGWTKGVGSKGRNSTLSEYGHVAYQIKENHECSSMSRSIMPADPYPTPTPNPLTLKVKIQLFSEHGHVAYQIKEFYKCSNMVANILPADSPDPGDGVNRSKFNFFRTWSCCISN